MDSILFKLVAASDVNVDLDLTFVVQMVVFTAFVIVLKPVILDPLMQVFEEREFRTDGARKEAREMDKRAAELMTEYEAELDKVRSDAAQDRDKLRTQATRLESDIMQSAREETIRIVDQGHSEVAKETEALRTSLRAQRPALAREIASKLLGREVRP